MPIPHQEMRRIIKRRIHGTEGSERIRILNELLKKFPGYQTGPYGELRKWVHQLIRRSQSAKDSQTSRYVSRAKRWLCAGGFSRTAQRR